MTSPQPTTYASYRDGNGRVLYVRSGYLAHRESYATFYDLRIGCPVRFYSRSGELPLRTTLADAQTDLDAYAAKRGLEKV